MVWGCFDLSKLHWHRKFTGIYRTIVSEPFIWYIGIAWKFLVYGKKESAMNAENFLSLTAISYMVFVIGLLIFGAIVFLTNKSSKKKR